MLILFDLDDTLLDHTSSFEAATAAIHRIDRLADARLPLLVVRQLTG